MRRLRVVGLQRERALDRLDDFCAVGLRLQILGPVVPRLEVHQRLGVLHGDVGVLREARVNVRHRLGVGFVVGALLLATTFTLTWLAHRDLIEARQPSP